MLRVNSNSVLVVPPFECAWLSGEEFRLHGGAGCVSFQVKGTNDVTVIFKAKPGSRRWQHMMCEDTAGGPQPHQLQPERNYTVILGSHRNTRLKFEKDGQLCQLVEGVPGAKLSSVDFVSFWINISLGSISVGSGEPGCGPCHTWTDEDPIPGLDYVGCSAWDKHVGYRNVLVLPPVSQHPGLQSGEQLGPSLQDLCVEGLASSMSDTSVCQILQVAELLRPTVDGLREAALKHLAQQLRAVLAADAHGFGGLPLDCMQDLLASTQLACTERELFEAVMLWGRYGEAVNGGGGGCRATGDLEHLLPLIRFPLMSEEELKAVQEHSLAGHSQVLLDLVAEAAEANRAANGAKQAVRGQVAVEGKRHVRLQRSVAAARFQRRHSPACRELMYMHDGDHNGVCHHLGTSYGTQEWVNPAAAGVMTVAASSPSCRTTDPIALLSGHFLHSNRAGPRYEAGHPVTWWRLDLGRNHRLVCNYYTLRQDGSNDFLRNWVLQGSNDGERWADLVRHINDTTIRLPGQYASWPLAGHAACVPYRFFQILLLASKPGSLSIALSFIEFYGYFHLAAPDS